MLEAATAMIINQYHQNRYLEYASDIDLEQRCADLLYALISVDGMGMVVPQKVNADNDLLTKITQCCEEMTIRAGCYSNFISGAGFEKFFSLTEAQRRRIIQAAPLFKIAPKKALFRFGSYENMLDLFAHGGLLLQPAVDFLKAEKKAVQDDECYIGIRGVLSPEEARQYVTNSEDLPSIERNYPIEIDIFTENYGIYCMGKAPELRMIADWDATGVVIIRNPSKFEKRLRKAVLDQFPNSNPYFADVRYIDPYFAPTSLKSLNIMEQKPIRYSYQKERRLVVTCVEIREPTKLYLGSIKDIATFLPLQQ